MWANPHPPTGWFSTTFGFCWVFDVWWCIVEPPTGSHHDFVTRLFYKATGKLSTGTMCSACTRTYKCYKLLPWDLFSVSALDVRFHGICPVLAPSIHLVCKPTQMPLGTFGPFCEIIIVSNLVMASDGSFLLHHSALAPKLTETVLHDLYHLCCGQTEGPPIELSCSAGFYWCCPLPQHRWLIDWVDCVWNSDPRSTCLVWS